ncbi:MAG TPA: hypothetical protein VHE35_04235, partial [Kofleriaceae bacterium]|nr:hypothetical protein [Kofleriaceae bacterium]
APPAAAARADLGPPRVHVAVLVAGATSINRRSGQVPPLAGFTFSLAFTLTRDVDVALDVDNLVNDDARHGTILASAGLLHRLRPRLAVGARVGLGTTSVNFTEPTFEDVTAATLRAEALVTYDVRPRWFFAVRPLSFDLLSSDELGGPILTWQVRAGVGYRFGPRYPVGP